MKFNNETLLIKFKMGYLSHKMLNETKNYGVIFKHKSHQ